MSSFRIGQLDKRIVVEDSPDPEDEDNLIATGEIDPNATWPEFAKRWASIKPLTGRELFNAQQVQADVTHEIKMWHLPGMTPKMRIRFNSRYFYNIHVLNPDERGEETIVICRESV